MEKVCDEVGNRLNGFPWHPIKFHIKKYFKVIPTHISSRAPMMKWAAWPILCLSMHHREAFFALASIFKNSMLTCHQFDRVICSYKFCHLFWSLSILKMWFTLITFELKIFFDEKYSCRSIKLTSSLRTRDSKVSLSALSRKKKASIEMLINWSKTGIGTLLQSDRLRSIWLGNPLIQHDILVHLSIFERLLLKTKVPAFTTPIIELLSLVEWKWSMTLRPW